LFKVKFWSSVTSGVSMISENGIGMLGIVGDAIGGEVCKRWRVPIRVHSDLLLLGLHQLCKADRQWENSDCHACIFVTVIATYNCEMSTYSCMLMSDEAGDI